MERQTQTDDDATDGEPTDAVRTLDRDTCSTVNCTEPVTVTVRQERTRTFAGAEKTTVFEVGYCDEHAEFWIGDRADYHGERIELLEDSDAGE